MIDSSIPMQYRGLQLNDPLDVQGKAMSLRHMGIQNQMMGAQMQALQQQTAISNLRRMAMTESQGDPAKYRALLVNNGDYEGATALDKQELEKNRALAGIESDKAGTQEKLGKLRSQAAIVGFMGGTMDHARMSAQMLRQSGDVAGADHLEGLINQYPDATPEQIRSVFKPFVSTQMDADKLLMPNYQGAGGQLVNTNPHVQAPAIEVTQTQDSKASNQIAREGHQVTREGHAVTMRGQNMTDAREKEKNDLASQNPKLTESQGNAHLYGTRMQNSHEIISRLEGKYSPLAVNTKMGAEKIPGIGGAVGAMANAALGENEQLVEQAQRDFINATLRKESGAVINPDEFKNGQKQYFPQPGDSKAVLAQKKKNREIAIRGMDKIAGPAGGFSQAQPSAPKPGAVVDGYLFNGGDPSVQSNWKKVK